MQVQNTAEHLASVIANMSECEILGPAPANIARVANRYRWQLLLKFQGACLEQKKSINWVKVHSLCPSSVRMMLDIDPLSID